MWMKLHAIYKQQTKRASHTVQSEFFNFGMDLSDDMVTHIAKFEGLVLRMQQLNVKPDESSLVVKLIDTLPEEYKSLRQAWNLVRKIVYDCVQYFLNKPQQAQAIMGELPTHRVTLTAPFHATGVDYAGPFLLKDKRGRGCKTIKSYVCVFVCFATKAMHLELISDLTSEAFIVALRRFASRRKKPAHIHSDNGTNFGGANRELKELGKFSRWQLVQQLQQHFWNRWSKEYFAELQQRMKWGQTSQDVKEGTIVLIKNENLPPL
ncbi:PREDICTED: uncharacterized protein LOC105449504 [Wasmannia auropunctata]|uniref:uncharacterized protein LOC105449504 n=1 Tax=Wasmannia auropunctata TaxID=64793 RepID=UPI0005EF908B|nr:PREDICTED: uncharacterized protein LOC105449504 [Wasmannia auropunctata]